MRSTRTLLLVAAMSGLGLAGCAREQEVSPPPRTERLEIPAPIVRKPMPQQQYDSALRQAPPSQDVRRI